MASNVCMGTSMANVFKPDRIASLIWTDFSKAAQSLAVRLAGYESGSNLVPKTIALGRPSPSLNLQVGEAGRHAHWEGLERVVCCLEVRVRLPTSQYLSFSVQQSSLAATGPNHDEPLEIVGEYDEEPRDCMTDLHVRSY